MIDLSHILLQELSFEILPVAILKAGGEILFDWNKG